MERTSRVYTFNKNPKHSPLFMPLFTVNVYPRCSGSKGFCDKVRARARARIGFEIGELLICFLNQYQVDRKRPFTASKKRTQRGLSRGFFSGTRETFSGEAKRCTTGFMTGFCSQYARARTWLEMASYLCLSRCLSRCFRAGHPRR